MALVFSGLRGVALGAVGGGRWVLLLQCTRPLASRNLLQMEAKSGIAARDLDATTTSGPRQHPVC